MNDMMDKINGLPNRLHMGVIFNELGLLNEGLEIGVYDGKQSADFLSQWSGSLMHEVDCWECQPASVYDDIANNDNTIQEERYKQACAYLAPFGKRCVIHRMYSTEAVGLFQDAQLDFVYLDGNHGEKAVYDDMVSWYPKVKAGGILWGDDWDWESVRNGVSKFCKDNNLQFSVGCAPKQWFIFK